MDAVRHNAKIASKQTRTDTIVVDDDESSDTDEDDVQDLASCLDSSDDEYDGDGDRD
jgi:hypothetical protein